MPTGDKVLQERYENITDFISDWVGRLRQDQKDIVNQYVPKFRSESALWLKYREITQEQAKQVFLLKNRGLEFKQALSNILSNPGQFKSDELIEAANFNRPLYSEMMHELINSLDEKQKKKLIGRIDDMLEDLQDLIDKKV